MLGKAKCSAYENQKQIGMALYQVALAGQERLPSQGLPRQIVHPNGFAVTIDGLGRARTKCLQKQFFQSFMSAFLIISPNDVRSFSMMAPKAEESR